MQAMNSDWATSIAAPSALRQTGEGNAMLRAGLEGGAGGMGLAAVAAPDELATIGKAHVRRGLEAARYTHGVTVQLLLERALAPWVAASSLNLVVTLAALGPRVAEPV